MITRTVRAELGVLAVYAVVRGVGELFVIDYGNPSSYRDDWGGPSLIGVLAVHSGPGLLALGWAAAWLVRHHNHERHSS